MRMSGSAVPSHHCTSEPINTGWAMRIPSRTLYVYNSIDSPRCVVNLQLLSMADHPASSIVEFTLSSAVTLQNAMGAIPDLAGSDLYAQLQATIPL